MSGTTAITPEPPYYAVIFTSLRTRAHEADYAAMSAEMDRLAAAADGYLGMEAARERADAGSLGITVSYWRDLDAIAAWKRDLDHLGAQRMGRERWYQAYRVRIARVERAYRFERREEHLGGR